jgi:uncharacterized protein YacL
MQNHSKRALASRLHPYRNELAELDRSERTNEEGVAQLRLVIGACIGAVVGLLLALVLTSDLIVLPGILSSLGDNAIALVVAIFGIAFGILLSSKQSQ